jgi:DNA-binding MarR family transcriptional regulator
MDEQELNIAWLNLSRVHATVRVELDRALARESGMGLSEGEVLFQLMFAPSERLRMSDLADRLCMAQSSITRVVDRLVERGLVARETRPTNRRTVDALLTPAGREAFERLRPVYMGVIRDRFGRGLAERDVTGLRSLMRRLLEGLGSSEEVPWEPKVTLDARTGRSAGESDRSSTPASRPDAGASRR